MVSQTAQRRIYDTEGNRLISTIPHLRPRYYDPTIGRLNRMDCFNGINSQPLTLNKYAYCHGDPINNIDPTGMFSMAELQTNIGTMLNLSSQVLRTVRTVDTAVDSIRTTFEIIRLLQGDIVGTVRQHLEQMSSKWRAAPSHWRTANLFKEDFWQDASQVLLQHSSELLAKIIQNQGTKIVENLNTLSNSRFRWVIYMPSPAERQLPNPLMRFRLPGLKILDRSVVIHFGPPGTGRLFGLGFENKRKWQSQFFRMDYHSPHPGNWVVNGSKYDFNFHTPSFSMDKI